MIKSRSSSVRQLLQDLDIDALCFSHRPNIRYLSGFTGSDGVLVVARDSDCFLTDSRYVTQAATEVAADEFREYKTKEEGVVTWLAACGAKRVGFEAEHLSCAALRRLQAKSPTNLEWVAIEKPLAALRGIKSAEEIARMEQATALAAAAFDEILPLIRPGIKESDLALALEMAMRRRGGEEKAFTIIVASGPRGALPHGVASDKVINAGELVTIDFGVRCAGYHSDETVTVAVGNVSAEMRHIHATVLAAHDLAIAAIQPGVPLRQIDAIARDYITAQGYGDRFGHGLGHGVGLEVHEYPTVSPRSEEVACAGMVFTVEPGIYIPDLGGVRIEDMILVTADGSRRLTLLDKKLLILSA